MGTGGRALLLAERSPNTSELWRAREKVEAASSESNGAGPSQLAQERIQPERAALPAGAPGSSDAALALPPSAWVGGKAPPPSPETPDGSAPAAPTSASATWLAKKMTMKAKRPTKERMGEEEVEGAPRATTGMLSRAQEKKSEEQKIDVTTVSSSYA